MSEDLLTLLAEQEAAEQAEQARAAAAVAVPAPRAPATTCRCSDRRSDGFTSPSPGEWVHAGCGLPTAQWAASRTDPAPPWPYYAVSDDAGTFVGVSLPPRRVAQLRAAGWHVAERAPR